MSAQGRLERVLDTGSRYLPWSRLCSPGATLPASVKRTFNIYTAFGANPVFIRLVYRQIEQQQFLRSRKIFYFQDIKLRHDFHERHLAHDR